MNAALFARIEVLHERRDELPLDGEQRRLLERLHLDFVRAGARLAPAAQARYAQVMERLAELTDPLRAERACRRGGVPARAEGRGRPRRPARVRARRNAAGRRRARPRRPRRDAVALARGAVPGLQRAARPARARLARLDGPRRAPRRHRQPRARARDPHAARRAGAPARPRLLCRLRAGRHHGARPGRGGRLLSDVWERAKVALERERAQLDALRRAEGVEGADRALGLALLGREGPPAHVRDRRCAGEALLRARAHGGGGLRLRRAPVRHPLRRTARPARLPPRRESVRSALGRPCRRRLPARQPRPAEQAQRGLDERLPVAVRHRGRRRDPDHRQQQQLLEGGARRADAAGLRRRAHAVPRVRPRPARAAVERALRAAVRHQRAARLRRAAVPALRALGRGARRAGAPCPPRGHRRADPAGAGRAAARGAPLRPGLRDRALHGQRARRHGGACAARGAGRHRGLRGRGAGARGAAARRRPEPSPAALPASLRQRRVCGGLLRVPVGRGARLRCLRRLPGGRQPVRQRHGASAARSTSMRRATASSPAPRSRPSAAARRGSSRCWPSGGSSTSRPEPHRRRTASPSTP